MYVFNREKNPCQFPWNEGRTRSADRKDKPDTRKNCVSQQLIRRVSEQGIFWRHFWSLRIKTELFLQSPTKRKKEG